MSTLDMDHQRKRYCREQTRIAFIYLRKKNTKSCFSQTGIGSEYLQGYSLVIHLVHTRTKSGCITWTLVADSATKELLIKNISSFYDSIIYLEIDILNIFHFYATSGKNTVNLS